MLVKVCIALVIALLSVVTLLLLRDTSTTSRTTPGPPISTTRTIP